MLFSHTNKRMHMINPLFYDYVYNVTERRSKIPLTGLVSVFLALRTCRYVNIYGFTIKQYSKCAYYWDCSKSSKWYVERKGDAVFHDFKKI